MSNDLLVKELDKELTELTGKAPRKVGVTKVHQEHEKKDVKVVQDAKIAQAIAKEAIQSRASKEGLNINIVNVQISSVNGPRGTERQEITGLEEDFTVPVQLPEKLKENEGLHQSLKAVMEYLPRPRKHNLINMMYQVAYENFDTTIEMAKWLGVERSSLYHWFKKMKRPPPEVARRMKIKEIR